MLLSTNLTNTLGGPGAQLPIDIAATLAVADVAEDSGSRPANHFFNPLTGEGFTHLLGGEPAPRWALGAIVDEHGAVVVDESDGIGDEPRLSFRSAPLDPRHRPIPIDEYATANAAQFAITRATLQEARSAAGRSRGASSVVPWLLWALRANGGQSRGSS